MDKLGWLIGGVLVAAIAVFAWQSMQPNEPARGTMVRPDLGALNALQDGDPIVEVRLPAELSPEARIGQRAFEASCAACHGINAAGQNGVAPPLIHQTYAPDHHGDMSFILAPENGVQSHHWPFGNMPRIEGLTRADLRTIVAYIRALQVENGIN